MIKDRLKMIEDMLNKNPEDTFLNYAVALEYKKYGFNDKAMNTLEKLKDLDPKYLPTYYQLGKLHEDKNNQNKAISIYKIWINIAKEKDDSKTLGELAEALLMLDAEW